MHEGEEPLARRRRSLLYTTTKPSHSLMLYLAKPLKEVKEKQISQTGKPRGN